MRLHPARAVGLLRAPWIPGWSKDPLWRRARAVPSLDLRFADNKSLVDATTGTQLVTFTRASSGTYVDSTGTIRTATTNLWTYSEQFEVADWTKARSSIATNTIEAPNGTLTADTLIEDNTASATHQTTRTASVISGLSYTWSIYCKTAGRSHITLAFANQFPANSFADFNLSAGTIASTGALGASNVRMQPAGDGWYRLSITATASSTATSSLVAYMNNGTSISYTGDGTSGIYLWGAQLEQSSTVGEYVPTGATINSAPRFDHDPTTGESLGLLVEEARTNSIRNNTMVGAVAGTPGTLPTNWGAAQIGLTREIVATGTENGVAYIDIRLSGTTNAQTASITFEPASVAASASQSWTASCYVKIVGGSTAGIVSAGSFISYFNSLSQFLSVTIPASPLTASLTRALATGTSPANTAFVQPGFFFTCSAASGVAIDITLRIGLPQLEQGAFATSVIPTSGTAATRAADTCSLSGSNFSSWYRQDEGAVFAETQLYSTSPRNAAGFDINDNSTNNRAIFRAFTTGSADQLTVRSGGSTVATISSASAPSTVIRRTALAIKADAFAVTANGAVAVEDTSGSVPANAAQALIGSGQGGTEYLGGYIRRLTFWPQRLGNEVLQRITQ